MTNQFQEQLSYLIELQQIDLEIHDGEQSLKTIPDRLKEVEIPYLTVKNELLAVQSKLAETEKNKKKSEDELADSVEKLRNREARLYAIKTNKEYQAALKEVADGKRLNKEREDRILQAMEEIDNLTKKNTQLLTEYADKEGVYLKMKAELETEDSTLKEKMSSSIVRRPSVAAKIEKTMMRKYEFVKQRYAMAVCELKAGICVGCSRRVPAQLYNEMLRRNEFKNCPSCQRLIYVVAENVDAKPPEESVENG